MEKNKLAKTTLKRIVTFLSKIEAKRIFLDKIIVKYHGYDKYKIYRIIKNLLRNLETIDYYLDNILKKYKRNVKKLERRVRNALRLYVYLKFYENYDFNISFMFNLSRKGFVNKIIKEIKEKPEERLNIPKFVLRYLKDYEIDLEKLFRNCPTYVYVLDIDKVEKYFEYYGIYLKKTEIENLYKIVGEDVYPFEDFPEIRGKYIFIDKSLAYLINKLDCVFELFPKNGIRALYAKLIGKEVYVYPESDYLKKLFKQFNVNIEFSEIGKDCIYLYQISSSFSGNLCKYPELKLFYQSIKYLKDLRKRIENTINFIYQNNKKIKELLIISNSVINIDSEEITKMALKYYKPKRIEDISDYGYKKYEFYKNVGRFWDYKFDSLNFYYSFLSK